MDCTRCHKDQILKKSVDNRNMYICQTCNYIWYDTRKSTGPNETIFDEITEGVRVNGSCEYDNLILINTVFRKENDTASTYKQLSDWAAKNRLTFEYSDDASKVRFQYSKPIKDVEPLNGEIHRKSIAIDGLSSNVNVIVTDEGNNYLITAFIGSKRIPYPVYSADKYYTDDPEWSLDIFISHLLSNKRELLNRLHKYGFE